MDTYEFYMQLVRQGRLSLNQAIERIAREEAIIRGAFDKYTDEQFLAEILRKDKQLARRLDAFQARGKK